jgi:hypothetical protein
VLALAAHGCSASMASCSFTISNYCTHTIWPGTMAGAGTPQLPTTGFRLDPGQTVQIPAPPGWSGRIWARTGCNFSTDGSGAPAGAVACQTGDCGGGHMECGGTGGAPPATLFEITLGKGAPADQDFYDVSLVDGYNLPVIAVPRARQGSCNTTGCNADLNLCTCHVTLLRSSIPVVEVYGLTHRRLCCCSMSQGAAGGRRKWWRHSGMPERV